MEKDYVRQVVTERLQDIFKQHYDEYLTSPENTKKCRVLNSRFKKDYVYSKKKYMSTIESSSIRSTVTKLRLDMNCT